MKLLIVGLLPFDSGKTSLAVSLIAEAVERGLDVGVCKPVTAFSGWYHYRSLRRSLEFGKLVGEDVSKLHDVAGSSDPIEIESPVVLMHMPPDPERVEWKSSFYTNLGEQMVAMRITTPDRTVHYYFPSNLGRLTETMRRQALALIESLRPAPEEMECVDDVLMNLGKFADECVKLIHSKHEFTVVESYNNASAPTWSSLNSDVVLLVAPTKVAVYRGDRYEKAVELLLKPPWLTPSEEVASLLKPVKTLEIGPAVERRGAWAEGLLDEVLSVCDL